MCKNPSPCKYKKKKWRRRVQSQLSTRVPTRGYLTAAWCSLTQCSSARHIETECYSLTVFTCSLPTTLCQQFHKLLSTTMHSETAIWPPNGVQFSAAMTPVLVTVAVIVLFRLAPSSSVPSVSAYRQKFSINQLLTRTFPHGISDDVFMDPCKSGRYIILLHGHVILV